ncbi:MAG: alanine racemase [Kofleriaceae bacterium]
MIRRTRVEVDLGAIVDNARTIGAHVGTSVYAVVKADGYGHGALEVAARLEQAGAVAGFAVSLVEEGVALRDGGVRAPVLVMGPSQRGGEEEMLARALTPVISEASELAPLAEAARRVGPSPVHLKVDTGMGRLGVAEHEALALAQAAADAGLAVTGLMTHFALADTDDPSDEGCFTYAQLRCFAAVRARLLDAGVPLSVAHSANSSAAMMFPPSRLDLVRCGIALYGNGAWASDAQLARPRRAAMRLVTEVAQLRAVPRGHSVGYGRLWSAPRDSLVAVLPIGYADGLPRRATSHASVLIRGHRCPLVGAISMDIALADVTDVPGVGATDAVVLLGPGEGGGISAAEFAAWSGLTEYEVTCGVSKRVPRVYLEGAW